MFNSIGPTELIIVLVIVLVIFGPKRLPGLGRSLGSGMREFHDSITGKGGDDDDDDDDEARRRRRDPPSGQRRAGPPGRGHRARRRRGRLRAHAHLASPAAAELMATALRPIAHEDRLSLVEHLDELRTRIIICLVVFLGAFALCFWQNDRILDIMDRPLEKSAFTQGQRGSARADRGVPAVAQAAEPAARGRQPRDGAVRATSARRCRRSSLTLSRQAAAHRRGRARGDRAPARDARRRRAVHGHLQGRRLRGAAALAAVPALPGVRVRPTGVLPDASARSRCR